MSDKNITYAVDGDGIATITWDMPGRSMNVLSEASIRDYAEAARLRLSSLLNSLARHDVHVADYYLRRGAYVAVVNRAKYIIEKYERTPAVEDALGMMAIAYRLMGMEDLAGDTMRVLELNFPNSDYVKRFNKAGTKGFFGKQRI